MLNGLTRSAQRPRLCALFFSRTELYASNHFIIHGVAIPWISGSDPLHSGRQAQGWRQEQRLHGCQAAGRPVSRGIEVSATNRGRLGIE